MKSRVLFASLVAVCMLLLSLPVVAADKMTSLLLDGNELKEINSVKLRPDGKITILYSSSGINVDFEKLPPAFCASWGITKEAVDSARASHQKKSTQSKAEDLERAIRAGLFRDVNGVVYDLRKPQPTWTTFKDVSLFQKLGDGALVDPSPDRISSDAIFVENLPRIDMLSDRERFTFIGKQIGTYDYINKAGKPRSIRAYDAGRACSRDEIPDAILVEGRVFAVSARAGVPSKDVLAALPQSHDLIGNGSGFFVTDDGYFITNDHVVRGATKVRLRHQGKTVEAEVVKRDRTNDLALLKAEGRFAALPVAWDKAVSLGQAAFTIGFPNITLQGIEPKYTDGKISSLAGVRDDPMRFQISVPVQPGNSGGPLVDMEGNVIGVVVARISDSAVLRASGAIPQNVNYAIKTKALMELFNTVPGVKSAVKPSVTGQSEAAIKAAQEAVAMVLVY